MKPTKKRKTDHSLRPPLSPQRESFDRVEDLSYDPAILGGKAEEVEDILDENATWNPDVIEELLKWGAKPPLHCAGNAITGAQIGRAHV